jgi:hypothetical protein
MEVTGFQVLAAVAMNSTVSLVVEPCSSGTARCFGGIYCRHLQGRKVSYSCNHLGNKHRNIILRLRYTTVWFYM